MKDVYSRLAKKLDQLPHGFPATESGVELKILRKLFSPEDAETALKLQPMPETAEKIAKGLGKPVEEMRETLDAMAKKGQIGCFKMFGEQKYMLAPFVPGIFEYQVDRLDAELAGLVEEYMPTLVRTVGGYKPALARVVPVNAKIDPQLQILNYEDMRRQIEEAKSFQLADCICRKEKALLGKPCSHPVETCLLFLRDENAFDYFSYAGRVITKEEALQVLDMTEKEGLVHATYNIQEGNVFVCNCCSCCCGFLRGLKEFHMPYFLTRSNFMAAIDGESCSACGVCAEERCPMEAIAAEDGAYSVLEERCIGCGVCSLTCPTESITLVRRPEKERDAPPPSLMHWSVERLAGRSGFLKKMALKLWLAKNG